MNIENINKAIAVMERVRENERKLDTRLLNMKMWQGSDYKDLVILKTEEEVLHACGTTCCFAGWLAKSPEFQAIGVFPDSTYGFPTDEEELCHPTELLSKLFGVPPYIVSDLIYTQNQYTKVRTVEDVINVLKAWRDSNEPV